MRRRPPAHAGRGAGAARVGLRINRAADDAAGLGVATNLETAGRSLQAARRNVQDAIAASDVADSSIGEITDMLQRMRALAVASSSETLADDERVYLDDEFGELLDEIDRVANSTSVGGTRLTAPGAIEIIVMVDTSDSMGFEIPALRLALPTLRDNLRAVGLDARMALVDVSTRTDAVDGSQSLARLQDGDASFDAALAALSTTGVGAMDPYTTILDQTGVNSTTGASGEPDRQVVRDEATQKVVIYVSDAGLEINLSGTTEASAAAQLAAAGWTVHALIQTGTHSAVFDDLTADTGGLMQNLTFNGANLPTTLGIIEADLVANARPVDGLEVQVGIHNTANDRVTARFPSDLTTYGLGIDGLTIDDASDAQAALAALDSALDAVNLAAAGVGATRNRLESVARFQDDWTVALASSQSTIEDADFAVETSEATVEQLLLDASTAALVQARNLERDAVSALLG